MKDFTERDVVLDGVKHHYVEGPNNGPAVVLVPGMDGTGQLFHRQRPLLMRSRRVATYALRDSASDMPTLVSDLAGVIETVAPVERRAIVIGESFGGTLAMSLALERPERVAALVVLNSFAHFTPQVRLHLARWGLRALPWGMMPLVRRATAARLHSAHTHADEVRQFMRVTMSSTREGYLNRSHRRGTPAGARNYEGGRPDLSREMRGMPRGDGNRGQGAHHEKQGWPRG